MAMSDCVECWETPCMCGYAYRGWPPERKQALIKSILGDSEMVMAPVDPTEAMMEAGCGQHECQQQDSWYSNTELSEFDCRAIYKAMLEASKEAK